MWSRLKYLLLPGSSVPGPRFVIHRQYQLEASFPQYDSRRPFRILSYLQKQGLLGRQTLRRPRTASIDQLQLVHSLDYLNSMAEPGALKPILGLDLEQADQDRFLRFQRVVCGGTLRAARIAVRRQDLAINLGGGFHHASASSGSGFCVFNDVAVAVAALRAKGHHDPILIIDLDLHDGDGTRSIFAEDPTVHTFSIHNRDLGSTSAVASTAIALGTDVGDRQYLDAVQDNLSAVVAKVKPGLIFYLAGSDPLVDDKLGDWRISLDGMLARDRLVMEMTQGVPRVILLAGGYGPRAWRHGAAFFSWILTGNSHLDIPLELELPVDHYRKLNRLMKGKSELEPVQAAPPTGENDWGLSEEDVAPPGYQPDPRFLGLFSPLGVELALEQYGLLGRLRDLGFKKLRVDLDLEDPQGHTIRIRSGGKQPLVVFETRLRIDRASRPGSGLLAVEWLLIQDARSRFEISKPLLPGQKYPGLGLLRDTVAVFVVLCEGLGLDGLVFTPSHFHLAALSRPLAVNPDPVAEGIFRSVREILKNHSLKEAAAILDSGRLRWEESGEVFQWKPTPVIIPVSDELKRHFISEEFSRQVQAAKKQSILTWAE